MKIARIVWQIIHGVFFTRMHAGNIYVELAIVRLTVHLKLNHGNFSLFAVICPFSDNFRYFRFGLDAVAT